jgi:hypothetical protein
MTDLARADSTAGSDLPVDLLSRFARVGRPFTLAAADGECIELLLKSHSAALIVGSGGAEHLRPGQRLLGRLFEDGAVQSLAFAVEGVEPTASGGADVTLRLVEVTDRGDERGELRRPHDAAGLATVSQPVATRLDARPAAVQILEVSPTGLSFVGDRRFEVGQILDVSFDAEAGTPVRLRARVARAERAVYGRTRVAAQITAIGALDQADLDRLCSPDGRPQAGGGPAPTPPTPRPARVGRARDRLRRTLHRT